MYRLVRACRMFDFATLQIVNMSGESERHHRKSPKAKNEMNTKIMKNFFSDFNGILTLALLRRLNARARCYLFEKTKLPAHCIHDVAYEACMTD